MRVHGGDGLPMFQPIAEQAIAQGMGFGEEGRGQGEGDAVVGEPRHLQGEHAGFEGEVLVAAAVGNEFGAEDLIGDDLVLAVAIGFRAQDRKVTTIAAVEDLDDVRVHVRVVEVGLI